MSSVKDDSFQLYDLRVEVVCPPGERILCGAKEGDYFTVQGEMLHLPDGQGISFYSLDALIACPDPNCKSQLKIIRTGLRTFSHADTTVVGLEGNS
ncbi:unnamed protein product [Alternaria alternata]